MLQVISDLNRGITVQVVDVCESCAPDVITLLEPQWASILASTANNSASIRYRQVLQELLQLLTFGLTGGRTGGMTPEHGKTAVIDVSWTFHGDAGGLHTRAGMVQWRHCCTC